MQGFIRTTLGCVFLALLAGCSGAPPSTGSEAGMKSEIGGAAQNVVSDEKLEEIQFRSLWTSQLRARVEQAWFQGEDVYVTTLKSSGRYDLVKINGESGYVDWTYPLEGKLEFAPGVYRYPPELRDERPAEVFIVQNDVVHCIDDQFGAENYRVELDFPVSTSVTASQDHFFVGSWNRRMYSFSKARKLQEWSYITDAPITAPATVGGVSVYFGSEDNNLYSLNLGGGYQQDKSWIRSTGGKLVSEPVFYSNRVYFGSWDYKVYCLDEYQGLQRWAYPSEAPISQPVFIYSDWVFAVAHDDSAKSMKWSLLALNRASGVRRWQRDAFPRVLAADAFHCYALDSQKNIQALRLEDGGTSWTLDMSSFDFVLGQDADLGRARERVGRIYLVTGDGNVQAIQPRR